MKIKTRLWEFLNEQELSGALLENCVGDLGQ